MSENLVDYILLDSGIHCFIWLDNSHEAEREYLLRAERVAQKFAQSDDSSDKILLFLLDFRQIPKLPELNNVVAELIDMRRRVLFSFDSIRLRFAYIGHEDLLPGLVKSIGVLTSSQYERAFFADYEQDDAIQWLLRDDD